MNRIVRRQKMFKLVKDYQASDIPKRQFCANHRIKMATFIWWQQRYRRENKNEKKIKTADQPAFIPVRGPLVLNGETDFEYRFPGGNRFVIPASTSIPDIITLVNGLQGTQCSQ